MASKSEGLVTGTAGKNGEFVRAESKAREKIDTETFPWESKRYTLYIADACGWAYRAHTCLRLLKLEDHFSIVTVHPTWNRTRPDSDEDRHCGWVFAEKDEVIVPTALSSEDRAFEKEAYGTVSAKNDHKDFVTGARFLRDVYEKHGFPKDTGVTFSTPMLFDTESRRVVNNESSDICEMLNDIAKKYYDCELDLFPADNRAEIEELDRWMYPTINNGVYRCGFAKTQVAYKQASADLLAGMTRLERIVSLRRRGGKRYLVGDNISIADVKAFSHLIRMDDVYVSYFKTPFATLRRFPALFEYTAYLLSCDAINRCTNMEDIRLHYFSSHPILNPLAIVAGSSGVVEELRELGNTFE